jgi:hypothetical protein
MEKAVTMEATTPTMNDDPISQIRVVLMGMAASARAARLKTAEEVIRLTLSELSSGEHTLGPPPKEPAA